MASVLVPVFYVILVFGGLWVFSSWYRRRNANKAVEPYFGRHVERDIYVSLLQKTNPPAPDHLLKAALVRRAMTDVTRIMRIREDKPALQNLLQKGSIGDDLWNSLLTAEKELEAEILETVQEANTFVEGWGQIIFQTATEMVHNEKMRTLLEGINNQRTEKEQKYGVKVKPLSAAALSPMPTPNIPPASPAAIPAHLNPNSPNFTASKSGSPSAASSDTEGSVSSPKSPKSKKKNRK